MPTLTVDLQPEHLLTIVTETDATSILTRLSNSPGGVREVSPQFSVVNIASGTSVTVGPFSVTRRYSIENFGGFSYSTSPRVNGLNLTGTGIYSGGLMSINTDTAKFNINTGRGVVVDNYTNPDNPILIDVTWPTITGITTDNLATDFTSYIGIDKGGNVQQFTGTITPENRRDYIILGILVHTDNTNVQTLSNFGVPAYDVGGNIGDLANAIGTVNIDGNIFTSNGTNLKINKSSGTGFLLGANRAFSTQAPNITTNPLLTAPTFFVSYRDGASGWAQPTFTDLVDPSKYDDDSGTLATVAANSPWQIQRIFYAPDNNDIVVVYGQNTYQSKNQALAALNTETFEKNPVLKDTLLRCFLVIKRGATDLSDTSEAVFVGADKFGQTAAEGANTQVTSGLASTSTALKTGSFTVNFNKAYRIDNSAGIATGTLAEADASHVGCICECWIMSDSSTYNVTFQAPNITSTINGQANSGAAVAKAVSSSAHTNYRVIRITIIDIDTYLIEGIDSLTT